MNRIAQLARTGLAGASLLTVACVVAIGCAPLLGRPTQTKIDNPNQVDALTRAQVWQPTNVASMDMRRGPRDRGAFAPMATINCRHVDKDTGGKTPKFACVMGGDELKVKYGRDNGEIYAEVAASRLLWALGFGADRVYPVRVICTGCPESLKADSRRPDGRAVFEYAVVDREVEGYPVPGLGGARMGVAGSRSREPRRRRRAQGPSRCPDAARGPAPAHRQQTRAAAVHLPGSAEQRRQLRAPVPDDRRRGQDVRQGEHAQSRRARQP